MLHLLKLFSQDIVKYSAVLILGLFSIIYIIENGAVIENIEKYQYLFLVCGLCIFILRFIYFMKILNISQNEDRRFKSRQSI